METDKAKFLLIGPALWEQGKTWHPPNAFPIGLGYIASVLRKDGYEVQVLDVNGSGYDQEKVKSIIRDSSFDVVGIGGLVTAYTYSKWLTKLIKSEKPNTKILAGGLLATSIPELLLEKTYFDVGVIGEGEHTILDLVPELLNGGDLAKVKGIAYKEKGKIKFTEPAGRIEDLDSIPFPAWELFPVETYLDSPIRMAEKSRSMNIITSRGCPNQCTYCHRNFGRMVKVRSAKNVIEEMRLLKEKYGVGYILFHDELLTMDKERTMKLCDELAQENLGIKWGCYGRVNTVDEELLQAMKDAGCIDISFGVESGSQKILDEMKKGITPEQTKRAFEACRKVGVKANATLMVGMFSETKETMQETVRLCQEADIYAKLYYTTPFPHTELYEEAKRRGLIKDEENYISKLSDVTDLLINLTSMSDHELIKLKEEAEGKINSVYFSRHKSELIKYAIDYYRNEGLRNTLGMVRKGLRTMFSRRNR